MTGFKLEFLKFGMYLSIDNCVLGFLFLKLTI